MKSLSSLCFVFHCMWMTDEANSTAQQVSLRQGSVFFCVKKNFKDCSLSPYSRLHIIITHFLCPVIYTQQRFNNISGNCTILTHHRCSSIWIIGWYEVANIKTWWMMDVYVFTIQWTMILSQRCFIRFVLDFDEIN